MKKSITEAPDYTESCMESLRLLEIATTNFVLGILPHLPILPRSVFDELIPALQTVRQVLGKETDGEVNSEGGDIQ